MENNDKAVEDYVNLLTPEEINKIIKEKEKDDKVLEEYYTFFGDKKEVNENSSSVKK